MEGHATGILRAGGREETWRILIRGEKTETSSSIKLAEEGKVSERRRRKCSRCRDVHRKRRRTRQ